MKKVKIESSLMQSPTVHITVQNLFDLCDQVRNSYDDAGVDDVHVSNDFEHDIISITRDVNTDRVTANLSIKLETSQDFNLEV